MGLLLLFLARWVKHVRDEATMTLNWVAERRKIKIK